MTGYVLKRKYSAEKKQHNIFLCSDLHLDSKALDVRRLKADLDYAKSIDADILIGGDVFDAILHGDKKRHTPSSDSDNVDQKLNVIVKRAYEFLKPYAKNIIAIGHGNHESTVMKFNSFDPLDALIYMLSIESGVDIKQLHYTGIVRFAYEHTGGGQRRSFDLYYNHGQGGNAEISKGLIMIDRHKKKVSADVYWFGHVHQSVVLPSENRIYMNDQGRLCNKEAKAIITGCYNKIFTDTTDKEYASVNFGEERMRTNQGVGGALLKVINEKYGHRIKIEV